MIGVGSSEKIATSIGDDLVKYGRLLTRIDRDKIADLIKLKLHIEKQMKEYIARTERILFEGKAHFTERLMQNNETIVPRTEWLSQWFSLKNEVSSPRTYLSLWRSGQAPLSYMKSKYKVLAGVKTPKGPRNRELYTALKAPFPNPKLQYIWEELLDGGSTWPYLWLPPTRPYYPSHGIYNEKTVDNTKVRKGLVFSSWNFVPTLIAAELSNEISKGHSKGPKHALKEGTGLWARFWHPSPYLCNVIKHDFFSSRQGLSFDELMRSAIEVIKKDLDKRQWADTGRALSGWQALIHLDFEGKSSKIDKDLLSVITGTKSRFPLRESKNTPIVVSQKLSEYKSTSKNAYSKDLLSFLAKTALLSPSVCLLRALISSRTVGAAPSRDEIKMLMDFCGRHWKAFFNREGIAAVINSVKGKKKFPDRLEAYLQDGNIQAMLDEYTHHAAEPRKSGEKSPALNRFLVKLSLALGSRKSSLTVKKGHRQRARVATDRIKAFGQDEDQNDSRESLREAFNSPFWPFVLVTTSVGQEGLDFHLYCKEIFHWNLPSNPIQFEQREGRINRYSALWVREAVSKALPEKDHWGQDHWRGLFDEAKRLGDRFVRHGVGISPRWSYSKTEKGPKVRDVGYVRHVLAIPGSEESLRYQQMLSSLEQYRLTLGQSNQEQFLKRLKELNLKKMGYDAKGLMICLFPGEMGVHRTRLYKELKKPEDYESLCVDANKHLLSMEADAKKKIQPLVTRAIQQIRAGGKKEKEACTKALLYFIDPFDEIKDFTPGRGWDDDIEVFQKALMVKG
ncbi:MAG: hypothetical protein J0L75_11985 [Spirochaetes bacterium]|nr:hypothetical protein [Spirochaetota bacterium]